jgi:hypothetical protein
MAVFGHGESAMPQLTTGAARMPAGPAASRVNRLGRGALLAY